MIALYNAIHGDIYCCVYREDQSRYILGGSMIQRSVQIVLTILVLVGILMFPQNHVLHWGAPILVLIYTFIPKAVWVKFDGPKAK